MILGIDEMVATGPSAVLAEQSALVGLAAETAVIPLKHPHEATGSHLRTVD